MDSIKNSANFELCFIFFYEHYAWVTIATYWLLAPAMDDAVAH